MVRTDKKLRSILGIPLVELWKLCWTRNRLVVSVLQHDHFWNWSIPLLVNFYCHFLPSHNGQFSWNHIMLLHSIFLGGLRPSGLIHQSNNRLQAKEHFPRSKLLNTLQKAVEQRRDNPLYSSQCPVPEFCLNGGTCQYYSTIGEQTCQYVSLKFKIH